MPDVTICSRGPLDRPRRPAACAHIAMRSGNGMGPLTLSLAPPVAELVDAPDSKFVDGRFDPFRSVLTSVDLYCENRPHVPFRPVQYRPVVPCW
jgi:hypothetical protein